MNRIKELRTARNMKQAELSKAMRVTQGALSSWENGRYQPDNEAIIRLAEFFQVSTDYLLGRNDKIAAEHKKGVKIPVLGDVAAGIPIYAVEEVLDYEEIDPGLTSGGEYFALQIRGDSMEPRILDGDVVIVRQQSTVDNGDIAVVLVNGDSATVKRIKKSPSGVMLIPNNPAYEPMFYDNEDIETLPVEILGKVIELRGKF